MEVMLVSAMTLLLLACVIGGNWGRLFAIFGSVILLATVAIGIVVYWVDEIRSERSMHISGHFRTMTRLGPSVTDTIDGQPGAVTAYLYDGLNRVTRITQDGQNVSEKRVDFSYNGLGQFAEIDRFPSTTMVRGLAPTPRHE